MEPTSDEPATADWNELHREHYAQRGRKVAIALIALSALLFALVAIVVAIAG